MSLIIVGSQGPSACSPIQFPNLFQWVDSGLGSPSASGAGDQSGRSNNITQPSAGLRPTYNASGGKNNLPYWAFRKTSAFQNPVNPASLNIINALWPYTITAVLRWNSVPAAATFYTAWAIKSTFSAASLFNDLYAVTNAGYQPYSFKAQMGGGAAAVGTANAITTANPLIITVTYDGSGNTATPSAYGFYLNNVAQTVVVSGSLGRTTTDLGSIGGRLTSANALTFGADMDFYSLTIHRRVMPVNELNYLYTNYYAPKFT